MLVLGINSGTSVDGLDFALVDWDANNLRNFKIIKEVSFEFDPIVKKEIEVLIAKQKCTLEELAQLNYKLSQFTAALTLDFIQEIPEHKIELIGMHGQTVFHGIGATMQLGNPSVVAKLTGIMTIGDFRSGDIALNGCGAPLMSFFDDQILRLPTEAIATLNIGGIANITVMEPGKPTIAYDTGPGNTLIDSLMKKLFKQDYDIDGQVAFQGRIDQRFIEQIIYRTPYFKQEPPKATGRELFDEKYADRFLDLGNKENIITNVTYFTAHTISVELKKYNIKKVYVSGGGMHNKFIMHYLEAMNSGVTFMTHDEFNIRGQFKEAMLFSLLAFTCYKKINNNVPSSTGAKRATILGVIALP